MTGDRKAYFRVQQYYGELLADFYRRQADIAAEQEAKLAGSHHPPPAEPTSPAAFDEDDFSNNTWLR